MDVALSGTRKEELLMSSDQLRRVWVLRAALDQMSPVEAMELLLDRLRKSNSNAEFLDTMAA